MTAYQLLYCNDHGEVLAHIQDVQDFGYVITRGDVGYGRFNIPNRGQLYAGNKPDNRIHVYRARLGGGWSFETMIFLRQRRLVTDENGRDVIMLAGHDQNGLLARRINAYRTGSSEAQFTNVVVGTIMTTLVNNNFAAGADSSDYDGNATTLRDLTPYGLSVAADPAYGPSVIRSNSWVIILEELKRLQAMSRTDANEVFFDILPISNTSFRFQTFTGQPGSDRTAATGTRPIVASLANGNLLNPILDLDYTEEKSHIIAGGQGQDTAVSTNRIIQEAVDAKKEGLSVFGRNEAFYNASRFAAPASVLDAANSELAARRATGFFTGGIIDTTRIPYRGKGWAAGDRITVDYGGFQFDAQIRAVAVSVAGDGQETIVGRLEVKDVGEFF